MSPSPLEITSFSCDAQSIVVDVMLSTLYISWRLEREMLYIFVGNTVHVPGLKIAFLLN